MSPALQGHTAMLLFSALVADRVLAANGLIGPVFAWVPGRE